MNRNLRISLRREFFDATLLVCHLMCASVLVYQLLFSHNLHDDVSSLVVNHSNTDKMTDEEKLPIAIAGVAFITLPFIAGLIALYAAQGN